MNSVNVLCVLTHQVNYNFNIKYGSFETFEGEVGVYLWRRRVQDEEAWKSHE